MNTYTAVIKLNKGYVKENIIADSLSEAKKMFKFIFRESKVKKVYKY